jgi:4'-phosphopantetheinyl transferase
MIEWLNAVVCASSLPAAWLLDLDCPRIRGAALAVVPTTDDLQRASSRPVTEREGVLVRRGLVRLCVAAATNRPVSDVVIGWTAGGAPMLRAPLAGLHLSWAQRRGQFACALAQAPIGIDIETADGGEIPWNALHPDEQAALREADPATRGRLFLRIWAAKEAYGKALGEGLRREPASFAVRAAEMETASIDDPVAPGREVRIAFAPIRDRASAGALALLAGLRTNSS